MWACGIWSVLRLLLALICAAVDSSHGIEWNKDEIAADGSPRCVAVEDIDGDGYLDVVSASSSGDYFFWLKNNGNGTFTHDVIGTWGANNYARDVFIADIDQDGYFDIVGASSGDDTIAWYKQSQSGGVSNFTENVITTGADNTQSIFAIDLDGDGDIDIISGNYYAGSITWYDNDGFQSFTRRIVSADASAVYEIFAIDMDGDGDIDVVSASQSGFDLITWYENDGGNFTAHVVYQDAVLPRCIYPIDFDGDGYVDILAGSEGDNTVWFFKNDGSQNFSTNTIHSDAVGVRGIFVADVDRDGDLDVVAALYEADSLVWYETHSDGYEAHLIDSACEGAFAVAVKSVTDDMYMNIVLASENDNRVSLYTHSISGDDYAEEYNFAYVILALMAICVVCCVSCCGVASRQGRRQYCSCYWQRGHDSGRVRDENGGRSHSAPSAPRLTTAEAVVWEGGREIIPVVQVQVQYEDKGPHAGDKDEEEGSVIVIPVRAAACEGEQEGGTGQLVMRELEQVEAHYLIRQEQPFGQEWRPNLEEG